MRSLPVLLVTAVVCIGCGSSVPKSTPDLLGWVPQDTLHAPAYVVFQSVYDTCTIDQRFVETIGQVQPGVDFLVFFGSWCSDSQRELPRFLKIADLTGIDPGRIRLYGLDRSKKSPDGLTEKYGITLVPTVILLKGENEVGRITERPEVSMEANLLTLLVEAQRR